MRRCNPPSSGASRRFSPSDVSFIFLFFGSNRATLWFYLGACMFIFMFSLSFLWLEDSIYARKYASCLSSMMKPTLWSPTSISISSPMKFVIASSFWNWSRISVCCCWSNIWVVGSRVVGYHHYPQSLWRLEKLLVWLWYLFPTRFLGHHC